MTESKLFHLGDILSITTGRLVSPRHMEGVYDILNYMTNDDLYTHQLPRVSRECAPYLLQQHPALADIDTSLILPGDNWREWLGAMESKYGEYLPVSPIPEDDHDRIHPIEELVQMAGDKPVIAIEQRTIAPEPVETSTKPTSFKDVVIGGLYYYRPDKHLGHGSLNEGDKVKVVDVHPHRGPQPIEVEIIEGENVGMIVYLLIYDCLSPK